MNTVAEVSLDPSRLCGECEEPISAKRLAALPNARLCIACQDKKDLKPAAEYTTNLGRLCFSGTVSEEDRMRPFIRHRSRPFSTGGLASVIR